MFNNVLKESLTDSTILQVLCISPDDDMGFLINLPAPCNLLYQPNPSAEEGIVKYLFNILKMGMKSKTSINAKLCN